MSEAKEANPNPLVLLQELDDETKKNAAIAVGALAIMKFLGLGFILNVAGFLYPAYATVKAREDGLTSDDVIQWSSFWVIFHALRITEGFLPFLFKIIPYYSVGKLGLFVYLCHPDTLGAKKAYEDVLLPRIKGEKVE